MEVTPTSTSLYRIVSRDLMTVFFIEDNHRPLQKQNNYVIELLSPP